MIALAIGLSLAAAGTAGAGSGGLSVNGGEPQAAPQLHTASTFLRGAHFGSRVLREGMRGDDVKALHGIVKARPYGHRLGLRPLYHRGTSGVVRRFQREKSMRPTGIVNRRTAREMVRSMNVANTTWYGPGFYGNTTACGQTLRVGTVGVAHRTLPCGTRVTFRHKGRSLVTRVIDRGPFVSGIDWDLTNAARLRLDFDGSGPIRYVVADR